MNENRRIDRIARYDVEDIGTSEEDVKINFIVPLLEALGRYRINFEHKRKDIIVRKGLHSRCSLLVETKRYGEPLFQHLSQLQRYWNEERTLLAILTNGEEIWIFSPFWVGKQFEDTIIMKIRRAQLTNKEIKDALFNIMSKEALTSGEALENVRKMEDQIENAEKKKKELEEQKLNLESEKNKLEKEMEQKIQRIREEYEKHFYNITKELSRIDEQIKEIDEKIPKLPERTKSSPSLPPDEDYCVADISTYDHVNYWGLALGRQIMVCTKKKGKNKWFLWYKKGRIPKYKLSPEGKEFLRSMPEPHGSSYIADVEYLLVPGNKLEFWERLYNEKIFPYWDPVGGPYSFMKNIPPTNQYIAICRVYKINRTIEENDVIRSRAGAKLKEEKLKEIKEAIKTKTPVISDNEFNRIKAKIKEIIRCSKKHY